MGPGVQACRMQAGTRPGYRHQQGPRARRLTHTSSVSLHPPAQEGPASIIERRKRAPPPGEPPAPLEREGGFARLPQPPEEQFPRAGENLGAAHAGCPWARPPCPSRTAAHLGSPRCPLGQPGAVSPWRWVCPGPPGSGGGEAAAGAEGLGRHQQASAFTCITSIYIRDGLGPNDPESRAAGGRAP